VKTLSARAIKGFSSILEAGDRTPLRRNTDPAEVADDGGLPGQAIWPARNRQRDFVDSGMHVMGF